MKVSKDFGVVASICSDLFCIFKKLRLKLNRDVNTR